MKFFSSIREKRGKREERGEKRKGRKEKKEREMGETEKERRAIENMDFSEVNKLRVHISN